VRVTFRPNIKVPGRYRTALCAFGPDERHVRSACFFAHEPSELLLKQSLSLPLLREAMEDAPARVLAPGGWRFRFLRGQRPEELEQHWARADSESEDDPERAHNWARSLGF
jgi:hypothetical protein